MIGDAYRSNTGPLIALAKINQLALLQQLFSGVVIPPAVHRELLAKSGVEAQRLNVALTAFIEIVAEPALMPVVAAVTDQLESGEKQAIALAHARGHVLVIDERLGRKAARQLDLVVTGSTGLLIESKRRGLIPAVRPLLELARQQGYWLSEALIAMAQTLGYPGTPAVDEINTVIRFLRLALKQQC